jgi:RNA polymerase sigma factor (sigma-70 family)
LSGFSVQRQLWCIKAMIDDEQLLQRYVKTGDETAFSTIVEQYKGLVYGSALRQTNNAALAEEITQAVFIVLARKASTLKPGTILSGWLFRATRFISCSAIKAEQRRVKREQTSMAMNPELNDGAAGANDQIWQEISPVLDEALTHLGEKDRNALLLRFFEQKNLLEVGQALGVGEDGARKRVERALDKLRGLLGRRGVAVSAAMLATVLAANAVPSLPATLAAGVALTGTAATAPMVKGALAFMALSKTKIALATVATLLVINGGVLVTFLANQKHQLRQQESAGPETILGTPASVDGFTTLFNGTDLTGWKYNTQVWSVVNGTIVGRLAPEASMQNHCLIWAGGEVDDFELRLKFRTTGNANSGVSMRALQVRYGGLPGYHAEIEGSRTGLFIIGGPGRERKLSRAGWRTIAGEENGQDLLEQVEQVSDAMQVAQARQGVESGEWCDFVLIAQGPRVVTILNGVTITDTRDEHPTKSIPRGLMGLEYVHNPGREDMVEFQDIRFKQLPPGAPQ